MINRINMMNMTGMNTRRTSRHGFTITELLVVVGLIVLLIGILLPALAAVKSGGLMTKSMSNMRQIATWMRLYSTDNREFIVPSQFDYSDNSYPGKVRATLAADTGDPIPPQQGPRNAGTWTDILWVVNEVASFPGAVKASGHDYTFDSPDIVLYDILGDDVPNPFRSAAENTANVVQTVGGPAPEHLPTPFGDGARELGRPGFFAANNFFDANPNHDDYGWFTTAQIKIPEQSMYLVDSFYGETIEDEPGPFDRQVPPPPDDEDPPTIEADFRYAGKTCLMLFLDGHVQPQGIWKDIDDLQGLPDGSAGSGRGIRIQNLTQN